jgi:WD40 repeat protein
MMGVQAASAQLFYDFCLDDHVPSDHLLRSIDGHLDFEGLRQTVKPFYSQIGRPSIDPELMIRMLMVGYCMGIRSERRLCEEVHLNLAYRWFCRLGLDGKVHSHLSTWDIFTSRQTTDIPVGESASKTLAVTSQGKYAFVGQTDGNLAVWNLQTHILERVWRAHDRLIVQTVISEDQRTLLTASVDGELKCWDIPSGILRWKSHLHKQAIISLSVSDVRREVITSSGKTYDIANSADTSVRVWNLDTGELLDESVQAGDVIKQAIFLTHKKLILLLGSKGTVYLRNPATHTFVSAIKSTDHPSFTSVISTEVEDKILLGELDDIVELDLSTKEMSTAYAGNISDINSVATNNGSDVVLAAAGFNLIIWKVKDNLFYLISHVDNHKPRNLEIENVAISGDGRYAAVRWDDSSIDILNAVTKEV